MKRVTCDFCGTPAPDAVQRWVSIRVHIARAIPDFPLRQESVTELDACPVCAANLHDMRDVIRAGCDLLAATAAPPGRRQANAR